MEKKLILISNDDGINANGIKALVQAVKHLGDIIVVAPESARSAMSNAITTRKPMRANFISENENVKIYTCSGTPTDCNKIALNQILNRTPDIVLSGINHGSNSSISVLYSGTMGICLDACVYGIPAVGFSLCSFDHKEDLSEAMKIAEKITALILEKGLPHGTCLNVNIPKGKVNGIKICRQTKGHWQEIFLTGKDPSGKDFYWLGGDFINDEKGIEGTDETAIENGFASVVPIKIDMTDYDLLNELNSWNID